MSIFQKKKQKALIFVDFEYMQISTYKNYGIQPPLRLWYRELCEKYEIIDLYVFADFSNPAMKNNLDELRHITTHIIETQNTGAYHKKDFTDFFLLDHIYQKALEKNPATTYILFTGDGHFGGVCRFLTDRCKKNVVIYGIEGNISGVLRARANEVVTFPSYDMLKRLYYPIIAKYILNHQKAEKRITEAAAPKNVSRGRGRAGGKKDVAEQTGRGTQTRRKERTVTYLSESDIIRGVTEEKKLYKKAVEDALEEMLALGYAEYAELWVSTLKRTRVLVCNAEKLRANGIL